MAVAALDQLRSYLLFSRLWLTSFPCVPIGGYELAGLGTNAVKHDPKNKPILLPYILVGLLYGGGVLAGHESRHLVKTNAHRRISQRARGALLHLHCSFLLEDKLKVQALVAQIPRSAMAVDLSTRFEVPIVPMHHAISGETEDERALSLANLFHLLPQQTDFPEFTVEKSGLEAAFIRIIRENDATVARSVEEGLKDGRSARRTRGLVWTQNGLTSSMFLTSQAPYTHRSF
ncbi:hypothetical protein LshimejAT787_0401730 [Lyophyllum shimeji]|uniref:Uncharacterized protein n=1 Tax=Lyophyllum shimeji TaxID=47721 RepID=A0A9P3UL83_LYOSH|nr:hypothetical protein LshimejAT787_0401730 [Lyophyllum shimeji]